MWGQASGPVCVKNMPFSEVLNSNPVDFKQILHYKKRVPRGGPWLGLVVPFHSPWDIPHVRLGLVHIHHLKIHMPNHLTRHLST